MSICVVNAQSFKQKMGQMVIVTPAGKAMTANDSLDLLQHNVGGFIFYKANITSKAQITKFNDDLKSYAKTIPFLCLDQEGGRVVRLDASNGFLKSRSAYELGTLFNNEDSTRFWSSTMAGWFVQVGANVNFAPVADVLINPTGVIGSLSRSYSTDTLTVAKHAGYFIEEFEKESILTSIKHFPGHGSAQTDSHDGFTDVTNYWTRKELYPFSALIKDNNVPMVMIGHLYNAKIDDQYPATLSEKTVDGILRKELGYNGIVITDDIFMGAISLNYSFEEAVIMSVKAGCDIILCNRSSMSHRGETKRVVDVITTILDSAVSVGAITETRINESLARIENAKKKLEPLSVQFAENTLPNSMLLHQNYPNPFNPTTTISFELAEESNVQLTVYSVLGEQKRLLAHGNYSAGKHEFVFDASALGSGIYFYTLSSNSGTITKKMLLLK